MLNKIVDQLSQINTLEMFSHVKREWLHPLNFLLGKNTFQNHVNEPIFKREIMYQLLPHH